MNEILVREMDNLCRRLIVAVVLAWPLLATAYAVGAPAPLLKREGRKPACPMPADCVMNFCGVPYRTTFTPDGNYVAKNLEFGDHVWVGSWSLSRAASGAVLAIHERLQGGDFWLLHSIPLDGNLRRGEGDWKNRFSLEVP